MAEIASTTFSQTDGSNTGPLPGLTGATNPNQIDNSIQAMMGAIKREHDWRNLFLTSGGSANAYTLTYSVAPASYYTGQTFTFTANFGCTGSATLNVNGLGAKTIKKDVSGTMTALSSGDIASGAKVKVSYDGTDFIWINWQGAVVSVSAATDSAAGIVELATTTETLTGTNTTLATTPAGVAAAIAAASPNAVVSVSIQTFTASGTWTKPAGLLFAVVEVQGPGGGSGGCSAASSNIGIGGGSGGGGYAKKLYMASELSATETVTIGAVGTGGAAGNNSGTAGGNSVFKAITANGGALGAGDTASTAAAALLGGAGGTATGGDVNISGGSGLVGYRNSGTIGYSSIGGISVMGMPAVAVKNQAAGNSGTGYGQGARGAYCTGATPQAGADGGAGIIIITEYKSQ